MMLQRFADSLALAENQPVATFEGLYALADALIGVKLFTLTIIDPNAGRATRIFTNRPKAYPVHGTKPMPDNDWSRQVIQRGEIFIANTIQAIATVFFDHEQIAALGCGAAVNIPVTVAGRTIGTINCLHEAGHFSPDKVRLCSQLVLPGAAAFLLQDSKLIQGGL